MKTTVGELFNLLLYNQPLNQQLHTSHPKQRKWQARWAGAPLYQYLHLPLSHCMHGFLLHICVCMGLLSLVTSCMILHVQTIQPYTVQNAIDIAGYPRYGYVASYLIIPYSITTIICNACSMLKQLVTYIHIHVK